MSEKMLNTRIINKHDTEENWLKATNFIPKQGEIIVYDTDDNYTYARFKIGDGETLVNALPFTSDFTTEEKEKLSGIASGAEVNQNAFSNIVIGATTISADSKTDSLTLAGNNVILMPDASNDKITIGITKDNVTAALGYTPPTQDTDTHYTTGLKVGASATATSNATATNGNVYLNVLDDSTVRDSHNIVGSGSVTVTSDSNGKIVINGTDNDTKSFTITASASDDDVVVLSGTNGTNKVTYSASHAKKGPSSQYTSQNTVTSISGSGGEGTIKVPQITVDTYGHVTSAADESVTITLPTIPTSLKNPQTLTFGSQTYDGSEAKTITLADLGLSGAMRFLGTSAITIVDGSTTNPITIGFSEVTAVSGDVVLYGSKEFVWNGTAWEELGNEGSYKVQQSAVSSPATSGNATAFIDTISQNAQGVITATKKNVIFPTLSGGNATAADATLVGGVTVKDHTVTVDKKMLTAGDNVTITGASDRITIVAKDTTYSTMGAATSSAAGSTGLVPAPAAGKQTSFLRGDGTWVVPTDTTYDAATTTVAGLMSVADKIKLDGITTSADSVAFTQSATSGNKVGTITINGTGTDLYSPTQTTISGNAGTATTLKTARTIDGVSFNGSAAITHYGECSTAAATVAKTVALTDFSLITGARIAVKFTVTNTVSNPTLNVNSTGAKAIMYRGSAITAGYLAANRVYEFIYDGTDWELIGDINTDTNTKVTSVDNHYTPAEDTSAALSVDASSATAATWNSTSLVTGVNLARDSKGHVVGVTVDSIKMPANPNTTYTLSGAASDSTWVTTLTPSSGSATTSTVPAATQSAAGLMTAADKAKLDGIATGATANTGDITGVTAGNGLTGGGDTGSVTLTVGAGTGITVTADSVSAKLRSTTALTLDSVAATTTSGRVYPVAVDKTGYLAVNIPWTDTTYTLPTANSSTLGGVKTTSTVTSTAGLTASPIINGVPYYKDTTYSLSSFGITATAEELNYTSGVTSSIQTQLNAKVPTSTTINGKSLSTSITLSASDVSADSEGSASTALEQAKAYTDELRTYVEGMDVELPSDLAYLNQAATFTTIASTDTTGSTSTTTGAVTIAGGLGVAENIYASKVYGAVWNDYAEYRECKDKIEPGDVVVEVGDDTLVKSSEDLSLGASIVSDTFGFAIGRTDSAITPVAVSGRVLTKTLEDREYYKQNIGKPVCGSYDGKVRLMLDEEIIKFPHAILGTVSSVPDYKTWGENNIEVKDRVWIKVK